MTRQRGLVGSTSPFERPFRTNFVTQFTYREIPPSLSYIATLNRFPLTLFILACTVFHGALPLAFSLDLENHPGKAIYQKLCLECHGETGQPAEGIDADPLVGNRSIESLAGRIERTMPEDEEHLCVGDEANSVAEYVFHAFYSPEAQARLTGIRTDLTRLTGPQLQNSVSDLIGSFLGTNHPPEITKPGLKGSYSLNNKTRAGNSKFETEKFDRVDSRIRFDYGEGIPKLPDGKSSEMKQFSVSWRGSIYIRETGNYEFTLRTRNGANLYINERNDKNEPTIDAWVAPNNEVRDETGKIFLLGGRRYYLRLDFFRYQEAKSSIELLWTPPHGVFETVPARVLTTEISHQHFIPQTSMPADDRSFGYERGSSVSRVWLDAVTSTAFETANAAASRREELARTKSSEKDREKKIREFAREFVARAYRRPLTPDEIERHVETHFRETDSEEDAIRRIALYALTSPQFLYPGTAFESPDEPWAIASTLALSLWDSIPDLRLRNAVMKNQVSAPNHQKARVARMIKDGRTRNKLQGFFHHWLELSRAENVAKDKELYPEFSQQVMADLRMSLELFLDDVVWSDQSDYRELLLSDQLYLNPRLGNIYGKKGLKGGFEKVSFPKQGRTGVITHPYLLTNFAYHNNTSPIHRGVFLTRNIVGLPLNPPPEAIEFEDNHFPANLTMREKVTEMTQAKACMACHSTINPLGFSLEGYDAIGRWRDRADGKPINDDSVLETDYGNKIDIKGPREVATYAAESPVAHDAFVRQLFHHITKQPLLAYGIDTPELLEEEFRKSGFNIRNLIEKIAITSTQPSQPDS